MESTMFIVNEDIVVVDPINRLILKSDGETVHLHHECTRLEDEIYEYLFMEQRNQSKTEV